MRSDFSLKPSRAVWQTIPETKEKLIEAFGCKTMTGICLSNPSFIHQQQLRSRRGQGPRSSHLLFRSIDTSTCRQIQDSYSTLLKLRTINIGAVDPSSSKRNVFTVPFHIFLEICGKHCDARLLGRQRF